MPAGGSPKTSVGAQKMHADAFPDHAATAMSNAKRATFRAVANNEEQRFLSTKTVTTSTIPKIKYPSLHPTIARSAFHRHTHAGVPKSLYFTIGVNDPAKVAAVHAGGEPAPHNHNPHFAPVPKPTIRAGVTAMTLAVLHALGKD